MVKCKSKNFYNSKDSKCELVFSLASVVAEVVAIL